MLFSSLTSDHLKRTILKNRAERHTQTKKHEAQATSLPWPNALPRKKKDRNYSRVPKRCLLSFSTRVKLLVFFAAFLLVFGFVALLQESDVCRSSDGSRVYAFVVGEKCLPLGSIPCQRANSRQRWFVLSPTSPRSGDAAVRAFQDPYQPMVVRARLGPSPPRCSPT